ncbi:protein rep [Sporosarcina sp. Te-1]|uniref:protein rep n=1 Tax=Sporosarcina sp. Te-1 TaxID=2818390 RepID=UPI001FB1A038|nr:protein rep [Sporosarcina sp. Te-1]
MDIQSSIDETAKYPVKNTDYMTDDKERNIQIVKDLEEGLYRKRLLSYGGLLKEIHKQPNLDDVEDGELIHTDDEEDEASENAYSIVSLLYGTGGVGIFLLKSSLVNGPLCYIEL